MELLFKRKQKKQKQKMLLLKDSVVWYNIFFLACFLRQILKGLFKNVAYLSFHTLYKQLPTLMPIDTQDGSHFNQPDK